MMNVKLAQELLEHLSQHTYPHTSDQSVLTKVYANSDNSILLDAIKILLGQPVTPKPFQRVRIL